jgi:hypothetical protein
MRSKSYLLDFILPRGGLSLGDVVDVVGRKYQNENYQGTISTQNVIAKPH